MRVKINITLSDNVTEEQLAALDMTPEDLRRLYEDTFTNLLNNAARPGLKIAVQAVVDDNTKEAKE